MDQKEIMVVEKKKKVMVKKKEERGKYQLGMKKEKVKEIKRNTDKLKNQSLL